MAKKRGRPTKEAEKSRFLEIYTACGTVELAAAEAKVSKPTIYNWMKADGEFKAKVEELKPVAQAVYVGMLEQEAHRRAVEGVLEPVYYQGKLVDQVRKFSDTLLIFLLKGNAPEKYVDRLEHGFDPEKPLVIREVEVRLSGATGS